MFSNTNKYIFLLFISNQDQTQPVCSLIWILFKINFKNKNLFIPALRKPPEKGNHLRLYIMKMYYQKQRACAFFLDHPLIVKVVSHLNPVSSSICHTQGTDQSLRLQQSFQSKGRLFKKTKYILLGPLD